MEAIRWVDAIAAFERDRSAEVPCPQCEISNLTARDTTGYEEAGALFVDRILSCPHCGARHVIQRVKA
jgi:hypothetical protein